MSAFGLTKTFVIDDIILEEIPNLCPPISAIHTIATASAARLTWNFNTEFGHPTSFVVNYRNTEDSALTTVVTNEPELLLTGLAADSSYWVSVAAECGGLNGEDGTIVIRTDELPCISWDTTARAVDTLVLGIPGTETSTMYPVYAGAAFSIVQHLFLASEIPVTGPTTITGIGFDYAYNQPYQLGNCAIYLSHSPSDDLSGVTNPNLIVSGQLVFSGTLSFATEGWNYIPFNEGSFEYDGTSNLSVVITKNNGVAIPTPRPFRQQLFPEDIMTRWAARPNRNVSYGLGTFDLDKRSNTRIITGGQDIFCTGRATCIPPITLVDTSVMGIVKLLWIPGYDEASWNVDYRIVNPADTGEWVNAATETNATEYLFSIADLEPGSFYDENEDENEKGAVAVRMVGQTPLCPRRSPSPHLAYPSASPSIMVLRACLPAATRCLPTYIAGTTSTTPPPTTVTPSSHPAPTRVPGDWASVSLQVCITATTRPLSFLR